MSRAYVEQRLREIGANPAKKLRPMLNRKKPTQRIPRPGWIIPGVRRNTPESPVLVCDCHPDLQATANNYVAMARRQNDDHATWFDVQNAFVIGYHIALEYHVGRKR